MGRKFLLNTNSRYIQAHYIEKNCLRTHKMFKCLLNYEKDHVLTPRLLNSVWRLASLAEVLISFPLILVFGFFSHGRVLVLLLRNGFVALRDVQ